MAEKKIILQDAYRVIKEDSYFEVFMFDEDINIAEVWPHETTPEILEVRYDDYDKDVIVLEIYEDENKNKKIYVEPEKLLELSNNEVITPTQDSSRIIID